MKLLSKLHSRTARTYDFIRKNYIKSLPASIIKNENLIKIILKGQITNSALEFQDELKFVVEKQKKLGSCLGFARLNQLFGLLVITDKLSGNVIELGTYKGGTTVMMARLLRKINSKKLIYTCDTFEGFPYEETYAGKTVLDGSGEFLNKMDLFKDTSYDEVLDRFKTFEVDKLVKAVKGDFTDTLPKLNGIRFSFALVDCDMYDSAIVCLNEIYPKMVTDGIMLFDDYETKQDYNLKKAVDDFVKENSLVLQKGIMPYLVKV